MISQHELASGWPQFAGQIQQKWGQLTDHELSQAKDSVEQLFGLIQRRTGTARREIEEFLDRVVKEGSGAAAGVASAAQDYAQQASKVAAVGLRQVSDEVQHVYEQSEELIRDRPAESLLAIFGAGIVAGVVVMLMMRSR